METARVSTHPIRLDQLDEVVRLVLQEESGLAPVMPDPVRGTWSTPLGAKMNAHGKVIAGVHSAKAPGR